MQKHLNQTVHNSQLHSFLCKIYPDRYFDWKITMLFYVAIHYLKALAAYRGIEIGDTHIEIFANCSPGRYGAMPISKNAWSKYRAMHNHSRNARYEGFLDGELFESVMKENHEACVDHLGFLRKYIAGQGLVQLDR